MHVICKSNFVTLTLLFLLASCASRTKYAPHDTSGGYSEQRLAPDLILARFVGNALTNSQDAQLLSVFRAVEICSKNLQYPRILAVQDLTKSQSVQRTSNYQYTTPTDFSGNVQSNTTYNVFGNNLTANQTGQFSGQASGGQQFGGASSWVETYVFPTFDTYFSCTEKNPLIGIQMQNIAPNQLASLVKDLMGAAQVMEVVPQSPNFSIVKTGDIITHVEGHRIQSDGEFVLELLKRKNINSVKITLLRDGIKKEVKVQVVNDIQSLKKSTAEIVTAACTIPEVKTRPICNSEYRTPSGL